MDDSYHSRITMDCLIHIFTYLTEEDLIRVSNVCKEWYEAAETPWLWRRMCLCRWGFCNLATLGHEQESYSWKRYFLQRSSLESNMTKGQTGSYTLKSLRGHTGRVVGLVYLQANSIQSPSLWNASPTVCSAATDGTIRAWNIQNGELLWCTPTQSPLTKIVCDEQRHIVITSDSFGLIKTWQANNGQEIGSFATGSPHCSLLQFNKNNGWFLTVGTDQGSICTFADFALTKKSDIVVCDSFKIDLLLVSPDAKWILAGSTDSRDLIPKVFYCESLTSPSEEDTLCQSVPVTACQAAVFIPGLPARLAVIHQSDGGLNKALTVYDVSMKKTKYRSEIIVQQVESFPLLLNVSSSQILLETKGSDCLVLAAGEQMWVYTLKGALLTSFKDHSLPISSLCVDSFRVVTASQDLSLRVLTWKRDREHGLTLESRYHLLGGSHTMSSGFTHVACDYCSIVASVAGKDGKDVLKAYTFTT